MLPRLPAPPATKRTAVGVLLATVLQWLPAGGGQVQWPSLRNMKTGLDMQACGGTVRRDGLTLTDTMCCTAVVPGTSEVARTAARRSA